MSDDRAVLLFGETYHHPNVLYRTHFLAPDPVIVVDRGGDDTTLWVSTLEEGRARIQARVGTVRSTSELNVADKMRQAGSEQDAWALLLAEVCHTHALTSVTVDGDFPAALADSLRARDVEVVPRSDLYRRDRRIKTEAEIEMLAHIENVAMEGVQRAIDIIAAADIEDGLLTKGGKPISGQDLVTAVESRMLELGGGAEDSICCGGPESSDPHRSSSDVLRAGLPIVVDIFPFDKSTRYWGDMTRTVVRGDTPAEVERMWEAVRDAQQTGLDAVRPGVNGRDIHFAICDVFKDRGYASLPEPYRDIKSDARFIHGTGHGVGLEIHEYPRIGDVDVILETGDVVTIEPGLYDPRLGGIRIEDLVVVTDDGYRNLTPMPKVFHLD